jgi:hypothetical protein
MPRCRSLPLILSVALAFPALAQEQVARVKSAPQDYRGRPIELEGEAVEIQALSPRSRQGFYRLVDPTDPIGILIRTSDLPQTGGPFRVRASVSREVLRGGSLLLDEVSRETLRVNTLPLAIVIAALGLAAVLWAGFNYLRARRRERMMRLAPPLWLIPAGTEPQAGDEPVQGHHFDYRLQYVEEERSAHIEGLKRRALQVLAPGLLFALGGSLWAGVLLRAESSQPAFVLLEPGTPGAGATPATAAGDAVITRPDDTLRVVVQPPPPPVRTAAPVETPRQPPPRQPPPRQDPPRRDPAPAVVAAAQPAATRDTARPAAPPVVVESVAVSTPPPPPPPAPEPEPERRPAAPAAPDPAEIRRAAEAELQGGIRRFSSALAAREVGTVATLYPAGGDSRRIRFLDFVRESRPEAALQRTEAVTVTETTAQAPFTISFRWRGEFGVARRKDARFQATVRRTGGGWAFEGARLLENMP